MLVSNIITQTNLTPLLTSEHTLLRHCKEVYFPMMVGFIYQTYSSTVYKKPSMRENCHDLRRKWLFVVKLSLYYF